MQERGLEQRPLDIIVYEGRPIVPDISDICSFLTVQGMGHTILNSRQAAELPTPLNKFNVSGKNNHGRLSLTASISLLDSEQYNSGTDDRFTESFIDGHATEEEQGHPLFQGFTHKKNDKIPNLAVYSSQTTRLDAAVIIDRRNITTITITNHKKTPKQMKGGGSYVVRAEYLHSMESSCYVEDFLRFSFMALSSLVDYEKQGQRLPVFALNKIPFDKLAIAEDKKTSISVPRAIQEVPAVSVTNEDTAATNENFVDDQEVGVRLLDVGGHDEIKEVFEGIKALFRNEKIRAKWGVTATTKILLHGPKGVGKKMLAQALANELGIDMIDLKTSAINVRYHDAANKIEAAFQDLSVASKPTLALLPSLDKTFPATGMSLERIEVANRMHDEIESLDNPDVIIVATADDLKKIHSNFTLHDMFDHRLEADLPDETALRDIWISNISALTAELSADNFNPFPMDEHLQNADQYAKAAADLHMTGANVVNLLTRIRLYKSYEEAQGKKSTSINADDIMTAIESLR